MRRSLPVVGILVLTGAMALAGPHDPPLGPGAESPDADGWFLFENVVTGEEIECATRTPFGDHPPAVGYIEWPGGPSPMEFVGWILGEGVCWSTSGKKNDPVYENRGPFEWSWNHEGVFDPYRESDGKISGGKFYATIEHVYWSDYMACSAGCAATDGAQTSGSAGGGICGMVFGEPRKWGGAPLAGSGGWTLTAYQVGLCASNCCTIQYLDGGVKKTWCDYDVGLSRTECKGRLEQVPGSYDFTYARGSVCETQAGLDQGGCL